MTVSEIKKYLKMARNNEITTGEIIKLNKNGIITDTFQNILIRQRRIAMNRAQYAAERNYGIQT